MKLIALMFSFKWFRLKSVKISPEDLQPLPLILSNSVPFYNYAVKF